VSLDGRLMVIIGPMQILKRLDEIGFERTRRALAALVMSLFVSLYLLISFSAPEGLAALFVALAVCYGVGFMGVAAEWFWGRWFAAGLGWSGVLVAIAGMVNLGWFPPLAIYGALHLLVILFLGGKKMAARFDMQEAWRTRYGMDDLGVARLRKTVTRAAASLPSLIVWALGPKEPGQGMLVAVAGVVAACFAVLGIQGLVRLRSWGLLALAASSVLVVGAGGLSFPSWPVTAVVSFGPLPTMAYVVETGAVLPAVLLVAALLPFVGPVRRFLSQRA